jgi:uncharacterized protein
MEKPVLFIHGAGAGAFQEDALLAESLQRELGINYIVRYPQMINEDNPTYADWVSQITSEISPLAGNVILVWHSVGGSLLIKYSIRHRDKWVVHDCHTLLRRRRILEMR